MRDFTWNYFSMTGDVNAYLLYKRVSAEDEGTLEEEGAEEADTDAFDLSG